MESNAEIVDMPSTDALGYAVITDDRMKPLLNQGEIVEGTQVDSFESLDVDQPYIFDCIDGTLVAIFHSRLRNNLTLRFINSFNVSFTIQEQHINNVYKCETASRRVVHANT